LRSIFRRLFYTLSYLGKPPWDTGISPPELLEFLDAHAPGRALDLGYGTGTNLVTLAKHGWQVCGIDFSGHAVKAARRQLSTLGLNGQVLRGDVSKKLELDGKFNLILDIGCYHDLSPEDRQGYRENLYSYLAPGGTFLIYAHCRTPEQARATGVSQEDIDAFIGTLKVVSIIQTRDRWERETTWMTFINPAL
jgi:cyclopropane fatty-acyl-phospholipid synthase-like methyltransferase